MSEIFKVFPREKKSIFFSLDVRGQKHSNQGDKEVYQELREFILNANSTLKAFAWQVC